MNKENVDKRKARRLKRRAAKKMKFMILDEGYLQFPKPTAKMKEHLRRIHYLSNQHLLNEDNELRHSATVTQSLHDLQ